MYLKIDLSTISAGLSHQKSNLVEIIKYCYDNNLKLIKPIFTLTGNHNKGKTLRCDLSKYYDLNSITVDGMKFKMYDDNPENEYTIKKKRYKYGLLRNDPIFSKTSKKPYKIVIQYRQDIIDIARSISSQLGNYMCIHVRRGDRITNKQIDKDTQADNIINIIHQHKPEKVYIMTNRMNELAKLKEDKKILFYNNFNCLTTIIDNYYLFCIENNIMKSAKIRCSTFNTPDKTFYHCFLTDSPGWQ